MSILAIIPARGGSKRIPKKNIKNFCGNPIISYSIENAFDSGIFSEVMVSTDDEEISKIAEKFGASVPFFRSKKASDDHAPLVAVLLDVLSMYQKKGKNWDYVCCILPTAPLMSSEDIKTAHNILLSTKSPAIVPIVRFSYPIQRALQLDDSGIVSMVQPDFISLRSQDLKPRYHDAGQYYFIRTAILLKEKSLFPQKTIGLEVDEMKVQDIDTETDWKLAELKYRLLMK